MTDGELSFTDLYSLLFFLASLLTGNLHYYEQLQAMREAYILQPSMFNEELFESTILQKSIVEDNWLNIVQRLKSADLIHEDVRTPNQVIVCVGFKCDRVNIKSTSAVNPKMTPVLMSISALETNDGRRFTFSNKMPPFIVGFYHGRKKPQSIDAVIGELVKELRQLSPLRNPDIPIAVHLERVIADAPATADLKNSTSHNGYDGLPRCQHFGVPVSENGKFKTVRFPNSNCEPKMRRDQDWDKYKVGQGKSHHVKGTSLIETIPGMAMVTGFVLDTMHTLDGGVLCDLITRLCAPGLGRVLRGTAFTQMNEVVEWYSSFMPQEFNRKLMGLNSLGKWKMRQTRNFFAYLAFPVMKQFSSIVTDGKFWLGSIKTIVQAIRLVAGFLSFPLPSERVELARMKFRCFFKRMVWKVGHDFASYINHNILHIMDDCVNFGGSALDRNSAYKFENCHQQYAKMIQPGPNAHIQLVNRMVEKAIFQLPVGYNGNVSLTVISQEDINRLIRYTRNEWTNEVHSSAPKRLLWIGPPSRCVQELQCEAFSLRNTFPNNVAMLSDGSVIVCSSFRQEPGINYLIRGKRFSIVKNAFRVGDSGEIGFHVASDLSDEDEEWDARALVTKCAIVPYDIFPAMENVVGSDLNLLNWNTWFIAKLID